ncbi:hypothetical protein [Brevibacillus laterosporus]|uniref:Uncharacterized protein n=1 Tax=Brevibacillus laterosporus TaxID=1465 RepID=A0AAP3GE37_BRELA|nr:hypothetical protein [Brevibacillus laterosporus]MCR8982543.1 hypothetical protein [Brevibacillus laterosporus]MCZ0809699.1 hypothetical protein [Brevibacillus laterosporus]MCZ0828232.1 hypothetical protein [Brevibacillus laterosporus]MCZ0852254.1 hypothetical protein [Brevibacillus laterosporus]
MKAHNGSGWSYERFPEWKDSIEPEWGSGARWKTAPEWLLDPGY